MLEFPTYLLLILILGFVVIAILAFMVFNMHRIIKNYESTLYTMKNEYDDAFMKLKAVDLSGAFEADDEVGEVFIYIKKTMNRLGQFFSLEEDEKI